MRHGAAAHIPTVITIHNIAFQGQFPAETFPGLGLPPSEYAMDGFEYYGGVGFLKAGLTQADWITTVSPTYAEEIRQPQFGMGLEGLISSRADRLSGIVNGIDTVEWDPSSDLHLAARFDTLCIGKRAANKAAIIARFGLDPARQGPLFVVITRLTWQKGMDLLADAIAHIASVGGQLAVLGSGEAAIEREIARQAAAHPGVVGVVYGYDEPLAHLMQGGGDAILIPSRFEPCGLTQLYGLRYGNVPIVARTGGLADTVIAANVAGLAAGVSTGIDFAPGLGDSFKVAITRAAALYADKRVWAGMQTRGMAADFSWRTSARAYAALYTSLIAGK